MNNCFCSMLECPILSKTLFSYKLLNLKLHFRNITKSIMMKSKLIRRLGRSTNILLDFTFGKLM